MASDLRPVFPEERLLLEILLGSKPHEYINKSVWVANSRYYIDGKAKLLRDDYCDGFGDCLPACPADAISFVEREAAAYDEKAVAENKLKKAQAAPLHPGCPGSRSHTFVRKEETKPVSAEGPVSQLTQWPVQIKLAPVKAPYFDGANLLIAADCTAYAYGDFHNRFIKGKVTLIGCPKLDEGDYTEKLTEIIKNNEIKSLTVVRMTVPCCGGIQRAAVNALKASGKFIPWQVVTITLDGNILD